jgi:hypothetical protein
MQGPYDGPQILPSSARRSSHFGGESGGGGGHYQRAGGKRDGADYRHSGDSVIFEAEEIPLTHLEEEDGSSEEGQKEQGAEPRTNDSPYRSPTRT